MFEQWVVWFVCGMFCSHLNFSQGPIAVAPGVCLHAGCEHSTEPGQKYCPSCKFQRQSKRLSNLPAAATSADKPKTPASDAGASTGSGAVSGFGKLFGTPGSGALTGFGKLFGTTAPPVSASGGPRASTGSSSGVPPRASTGSASGGPRAPGDKEQAAAASAPVRKTQKRLDLEKQARELMEKLENDHDEEYEEVQDRAEEEDAETATSQTQVEHPTGTHEQLDRSAQPAEMHANLPHPFTMLEMDLEENERGDPELIEHRREMMKCLGTQFKCNSTLVKKDGKEFFEWKNDSNTQEDANSSKKMKFFQRALLPESKSGGTDEQLAEGLQRHTPPKKVIVGYVNLSLLSILCVCWYISCDLFCLMMCMLFYQKFWEAVGRGWAVVLKKREEVSFLKKGEEASVIL